MFGRVWLYLAQCLSGLGAEVCISPPAQKRLIYIAVFTLISVNGSSLLPVSVPVHKTAERASPFFLKLSNQWLRILRTYTVDRKSYCEFRFILLAPSINNFMEEGPSSEADSRSASQ
jgi:hypothetical protein